MKQTLFIEQYLISMCLYYFVSRHPRFEEKKVIISIENCLAYSSLSRCTSSIRQWKHCIKKNVLMAQRCVYSVHFRQSLVLYFSGWGWKWQKIQPLGLGVKGNNAKIAEMSVDYVVLVLSKFNAGSHQAGWHSATSIWGGCWVRREKLL